MSLVFAHLHVSSQMKPEKLLVLLLVLLQLAPATWSAEMTPGEVYRALFTAANEGRTQDALRHLDVDYRRDVEAFAGGPQGLFDRVTRNRSVTNINVTGEEITGGTALVRAEFTFADGTVWRPPAASLRFANSEWKLTWEPNRIPPPPFMTYWRPDFPIRADSPEKTAAFQRLMADQKATFQRITELDKEIRSGRFTGEELKRKYDERDYNRRRAGRLQEEARLWINR